VLHFTTSPESIHSARSASASTFAIPLQQPLGAIADQQQQPPVVPAQFNRAPAPRRVATPGNVQPALTSHHSAPTSTGFVKETDGALKMHHSFAGFDAPGDTQPDSQIYKQYTSGVHGAENTSSIRVPSARSLFTEHVDDDEGDSPTDGLDMVGSSQDQQSPTVTSPTVIHDDDLFAIPQHVYAPTSPLKFETPAIAGRKRDNGGLMLSSAVRSNTTPSSVASANAFPGFGMGAIAPMSLTQAWQNTQAPTSPAQVEASEDVAFTRPSPNFAHARHSSPIPALSSPIKAMRDETPRTDPMIRSSSEPRAEYVSMKESQERRRRTTNEQPAHLVEQDSWDNPSAAQLRAQKKKMKEHLERQAAIPFAHISAPSPASPESGKRRAVHPKMSSPARSRQRRYPARPRHDDDDSADELARALTANGQRDDDSPDELSQDVPFTAQAVVKHNSKANRVQVPKTSSHPTRTQSGQSLRNSPQLASPCSQLQRVSQLQAPASQPLLRETYRPPSSKDSVAVTDSQPDATADYDSIPRPKTLRFPSSPSINQYSINQTTMATNTGYTSQIISSSMPPMPPGSSPHDEETVLDGETTPRGEEGVPSSPPISALGDDLTYDEHEQAHDEYAEDTGIRESSEPRIADEDTPMDGDDDLPVAKPELDEEEASDAIAEDMEDEDELDLVQPQKADLGADQEVPETLEGGPEEHVLPRSPGKHAGVRSEGLATLQPPRQQRQNTVPETDALEETQPSLLPGDLPVGRNDWGPAHPTDEVDGANQTNSTEPFYTAQEQTSGHAHKQPTPASSKEHGSDILQTDERLRSLQDIYNLPDTQPSAVEEEIEMPRLSGLDDEGENLMNVSSPVPPLGKRQKTTYTSKRKAFRSPVKPTDITNPQPDQPPLSPVEQAHRPPADSPPTASAQEREDQGADAALQARVEAQALYTRKATLKSKPVPRPSRTKTNKKGALKSVTKELLQSLSSPVTSPPKGKNVSGSHRSTPVTPTKSKARHGDAKPDIDMADVDEERDELADHTPEPINSNNTLRRTGSDRGESPSGIIVAPNRVFASWPGSHYYPATCLGRAARRQLNIRFDDGNTTSLDATQVRALDLRAGDHVKVDATGMKKHTYIVVGFKDKVSGSVSEQLPTTDCHGHSTIVLEEKLRDSLPKSKAMQPAQHVSVPMGSIYLTTQLWTRLRDRSFNFSPPASPSKSTSRITTPITAVDPMTTLSFTRRGTTVPSLLKDATARAASVASSSARSSSGVFSNMAFVLTSTAEGVDKEAIARLLKTNGGLVLEQGFHELFDYESADMPSSSQGRRRSASVAEGSVGLTLKPVHKDLGFVALITDSHSRSTKYIQALALNVPCLHLRWVQDSLTATRAAPFTRYLLPAGVSKFLDPNGIVRSRTMTVYDPAAEDTSFAQTFGDRDLLLRGQTVVLVTGKSKKEIEKRQPFIFLTHALGAANVGRCVDLSSATEMLQEGQWDWIYVDNGEAGVADAAAELFGTGKSAINGKAKKGKKRKRDETEEKEGLVARVELSGKRVRITCSEFVIQSLILGALIEE
jgi:hypothetical protein